MSNATVFSIPHSGTRSLIDILGVKDKNWHHFSHQQQKIDEFRGEAFVPLRNLYDVAWSWESRYGAHGDSRFTPQKLQKMVKLLIAFKKRRDPHIVVIEHHKVKKGARVKIPEDQFRQSERFQHLKHWYLRDVEAQNLFKQYFRRDVVTECIQKENI